jgi:hypothetical protein
MDQSPIRRMSSIEMPPMLSLGGLNAGISKALTDAPSEHFEGHNGVRMTGIEEKAIMTNVQHSSFFQEGVDDDHWADGRIFRSRSEADGRPTRSVLERGAGTS